MLCVAGFRKSTFAVAMLALIGFNSRRLGARARLLDGRWMVALRRGGWSCGVNRRR